MFTTRTLKVAIPYSNYISKVFFELQNGYFLFQKQNMTSFLTLFTVSFNNNCN